MNFDLPESLREIQCMVRELGAQHFAPHARAWDEHAQLSDEALDRVAEAGLLGIRVPEIYGGAGLDALALTVVIEALAYHTGSLAAVVAAHEALGVAHLLAAASDLQRTRWLPATVTREGLLAWVDTGIAATRRHTRWMLHGEASGVALGASSSRRVVVAHTPEGPTAFVLDADAPGSSVARRVTSLGLRAFEVSDLVFDGCLVDDDARVGAVGAAGACVARVRAEHDLARAALALGCGQGALDAAIAYARDRKQFGQPIAHFQAVQWMLADAKVELDAARLLVYRAAVSMREDFEAHTAAALLYAGEAAVRACSRALQVHGGYGYTKEFPIERHLRDAKTCAIGTGGNGTRRARVAAGVRLLSAGHGT